MYVMYLNMLYIANDDKVNQFLKIAKFKRIQKFKIACNKVLQSHDIQFFCIIRNLWINVIETSK